MSSKLSRQATCDHRDSSPTTYSDELDPYGDKGHRQEVRVAHMKCPRCLMLFGRIVMRGKIFEPGEVPHGWNGMQ